MSSLRATGTRLLADPLAPTVALCLILVLSLYARVLHLAQPCTHRCKTPAEHTLIFDESYYVNAARVIDGIEPPRGAPYHGAPKGKDPNAEHPQLAKLVMAGSMKLFGDDPRGWRMGSVLFGLIALVALYALVRAADGTPWLAVGATGVMALDNLLLVHGRIGTLDIYAVAMMLAAATLYLRRRPLLAGLALAVGACMKEVALYLLVVIVLLEALRWARGRWAPGGEEWSWRRLALFAASTIVGFVALLGLLDVLVPAYDPNAHVTYGGNPLRHIGHMYDYAQLLKAVAHSTGISSTPWQWLLDVKTIDYAKVAVNSLSGGKLVATHPTIFFQGAINPFVIFLAIPALFAACAGAWRERDEVAAVGACWCLGTYIPFVYESLISGRITYLYYMVIAMPGLYLVVARMFSPRRMPLAATLGWSVALLYGFIDQYPLRTLG
jgi:4-amino-4-deoxy-L-arabinose transferase-like glycosyltransferase